MRALDRDSDDFLPDDVRARRIGRTASRIARRLIDSVARNPTRVMLVTLAIAANAAIIINALALQPGRHPAPLLTQSAPEGGQTRLAIPLPVSRPKDGPRQNVPVPAQPPSSPQSPAPDAAIVRAVQVELGARGFYDGRADGVMGARTEAAIRLFERTGRLPETGRASSRLLEALRRSELKLSEQALDAQTGAGSATAATDRGRVLAVQRLLAELGYGPGPIDGHFGAETRRAIERFELDRGLPMTGLVGDRLLEELSAVTGLPTG